MTGKTCEEDILCGTNKPADPADMTDLEKKHTPVIDAPPTIVEGEPFEVTVEVGKLLKHPNENGHFIQWIELYSGNTFVTRVEFTPTMNEPRITVPVRLEHVHDLKAVARCNLHGAWESTHVFE